MKIKIKQSNIRFDLFDTWFVKSYYIHTHTRMREKRTSVNATTAVTYKNAGTRVA